MRRRTHRDFASIRCSKSVCDVHTANHGSLCTELSVEIVIGVEGNPSDDVMALQRVRFVMKEGKVCGA
jgi:hypothetical protein